MSIYSSIAKPWTPGTIGVTVIDKVTIIKGKYGSDEDFRSSVKDSDSQRDLRDRERMVMDGGRLEELIEAAARVKKSDKETSEFLRNSDRRALESAREKLRLWGLNDRQIKEIEQSKKPE